MSVRVELVCTACDMVMPVDVDERAVHRGGVRFLVGVARRSHSCDAPIRVSIGPQPPGADTKEGKARDA